MLTKIRESERNYEKEKAEARTRDQQAKAARQSNRSEFNYITQTPVPQSRIQVQQLFSQKETKTNTQRETYTSTQT